MDPEGNIYEINPEWRKKADKELHEIFREDEARFDGYMKAKSEVDAEARQRAAWEKRLKELEARAKGRGQR